MDAYAVSGWVSRVDPGARPGVVIEVTGFDAPGEPPRRVRARAPAPPPALGQGVRGLVSLGAPPGPAAPGGYDFSRRAWFDGIGGSGFSFGPLEAAEIETAGWTDATRRLAALRGRLAARIRDAAPGESGAIIAALVTGDRSAISSDSAEALRASGLGHLLAISGLHMALVGGGAFFAFSLALALIEPLARRADVRKPAAAAAILASTLYLALSGGAVSAQRAWVMLTVAFVALLFDRRALTLRNVAVAAVIVLALAPEALREAGFQMSFAAAAALVAAFEWLRERGAERRLPQPVAFFATLSTTSLVAGAATAAFAAFHFNRWASWGFFANLAAMPVFTLWVMPVAVIGAALSPLGAGDWAFRLAAAGMDVVLRIAETAQAAPGALAHTPSGPGAALAVYAAGFALLVAGRGGARLVGAEDGVAVIVEGGRLHVSDDRRSRYGAEQFARRLGADPAQPVIPLAERLACDAEACFGDIDGISVSLARSRRAMREDCDAAALVVFDGAASARSRRQCGAVLIDAAHRRAAGASLIYPKGEGLRIETAAQTRWRPPRRFSRSGAAG